MRAFALHALIASVLSYPDFIDDELVQRYKNSQNIQTKTRNNTFAPNSILGRLQAKLDNATNFRGLSQYRIANIAHYGCWCDFTTLGEQGAELFVPLPSSKCIKCQTYFG